MSTLTAQDRCDRCGAQAKVRVEFKASDLLFCAHHARQHGFVNDLERVSG
jgi:hypothetical protein